MRTLLHLLRAARELWQQVVVADGIFWPKPESIVRAFQGNDDKR